VFLCLIRAVVLHARAFAGVLDDVIPSEEVDEVCEEVRNAPAKNQANKQAGDAGLRRKGRLPWPSEPVSDLVWMPKYAKHLGHPMVTAVAKAMLDDHIRIAQFNFRAIGVTAEEQLANPNRKLMREWHTDWPHDLIGYGAGEKNFEAKEDAWGQRNAGCVRQPFPDVCMALTMIWSALAYVQLSHIVACHSALFLGSDDLLFACHTLIGTLPMATSGLVARGLSLGPTETTATHAAHTTT
jgi:hypothetical protein